MLKRTQQRSYMEDTIAGGRGGGESKGVSHNGGQEERKLTGILLAREKTPL